MNKLEKAFADMNLKNLYYLDAETGEILSGKDTQISREKKARYFIVPKLSEDVVISWMREFAEEMVPFDNPELGRKLIKALEKENPAKNFIAILTPDESGWIHGWAQWEADHIYEEIVDWFCDLPINIEDDMSELDDDCPLCRMMKEGVNDMETIKKGFQEANAKRMVEDIFEKANNKDK
ncbi:hypothetical protein KAR28_06515 [Candidatus Parcubacteria bacterium]|nr:hypothetical protein [Candidatus Parcubacteria bacterium]